MTRPAASLAALVAALLLVLPAAASAHAQLQGTSPVRDAVVARTPAQVVFRFDETVTGTAGAVRVFDRRGARVDTGDMFHPGDRGSVAAVRLRPGLPRGTYTATYRVVSADTHVVTGGLVFSIGARSAGGRGVDELLAGQSTGTATSVAFGAARAVQYAAIGVAGGVLLVLLLLWPAGTAPAAGAAFARRVRHVVVACALVGLVSALAGIALQGAAASGRSLWDALDADVLGDVLHTRFGTVWTAAAVLWPLLGAAALVALGTRAGRVVLVAGATALVALPALAGHASVEHPVGLFVAANVVHVAAMSVWVGGLLTLAGVLPAATRTLEPAARTRLLAAVVGRFSPFALGSVIALAATGTVQALIEVDAFAELLDTGYGRAVLVKIGLLAFLVALGAVNRRRTLPRLRALAAADEAPGGPGRVLRRTLRAEVVGVAVVLGVTGALAGYAPARTAGTGPQEVTAALGGARLTVDVDPATVGPNEIHVYLFDARTGAPDTSVKELTVSATLAAKGIGPLRLDVRRTGPGHYTVPQAVLGAPGTWTLDVVARVSDFDQHEQRLRVRIR